MDGAALAELHEDIAEAAAQRCFHCGEAVPRGRAPVVVIEREPRPMCCAGCEAAARTIVENGLGDYYRQRQGLPARPAPTVPEELARYDLPAVEASFVEPATAHQKEVSLLLEGVTCAACTWLIERRLASIPGVMSAAANYSTGRARVRWDARRAHLSEILQAVADIGYRAYPFDAARSESLERGERRRQLARLLVAGLSTMQVMMYAVPGYVAGGDIGADIEQLLRIASLVLTVPVVSWAAMPFYQGAWRSLAAHRVGMDVPVAIAILIAFAASLTATVAMAGDVYYDSIAMFVFLLLGARYLESRMRARATRAQQHLVRLAPAVAERVLDRATARTELAAVASLGRGDCVMVRPGATVPADGVVAEGSSALDESMLTGEARPIAKGPGDAVVGGALNVQSPLMIEVTRVGEATVLAGIVRLLERAQAEKPRIAQLADSLAQWFVAALLAIALAAGVFWHAVEPQRAIWIVVAVLVVTCPCALALATPAALTAAAGRLYGAGVLVTRGHALETLARATHVVFDKTGTLTSGRLGLVGVLPAGRFGAEECLALGAAAERGSEHPVAHALAAAAGTGNEVLRAGAARNFPGEGVEAEIRGARYRVGSLAFVGALHGKALPQELDFTADDVSVAALGDESGWLALFTFGDALRPGARQLVRDLRARGLEVSVLSGDRPHHVEHVARELGIDVVRAAATPEAKVEFVRGLQSGGAVVAMVGDGVNDAPVLAQAQVSIAMGGGAELAQVNADLVLLSEGLNGVGQAFSTAAKGLRIVRQNLAWAIVYNAVAVPLALAGWLTPLVAAAGMSASSLLVVLNALRLLRAPALPATDAHRLPVAAPA
jgi:Cu2+-exporting ATPase